MYSRVAFAIFRSHLFIYTYFKVYSKNIFFLNKPNVSDKDKIIKIHCKVSIEFLKNFYFYLKRDKNNLGAGHVYFVN